MRDHRAFKIRILAAAVACGSLAAWQFRDLATASLGPINLPVSQQRLPAGGAITFGPVGHEYRQDDLPAIAAAPDGSIWVTWLSYESERDDVGIRRWRDGKWSNLHWVPATSGDSWLPQVAADRESRVWVVWSQQTDGNWDIYGRRFDPSSQSWSRAERLTSDPLPDINPRVWSDGKGRAVLVWQGFRGGHSNIFVRTLDGDRWSPEVRITNHAANDWEPAAATDSKGAVWVAYDSYRNGNYDVFLAEVRNGHVQREVPVADTPRFEARATVAVDAVDRVWVSWEAGEPNWGKDRGYVIRDRQVGALLGDVREPRIRCFDQREWREPETPLASAFRGNTFAPHVFAHGSGVYVAALTRLVGPRRPIRPPQPSYWEYWVTRLDGGRWTEAFPLPNSKGRLSERINGSVAGDGELWFAWASDNRGPAFYHRPVRQQVFTGRFSPSAAAAPVLRPVRQERVEVKAGHADEPGDIQTIRSYRLRKNGKTLRIFRGDLHRHTELSWDGGQPRDGSLQDLYRYMIDVAGMDFGATTDHQGAAWPYWWWYTQKMNDMYFVTGRYVPIFGYERSASYPNGHRNVFFARRSEARVTPFFIREGVRIDDVPMDSYGDESADEGAMLLENDTKLLYEEIRARNGVLIPHTSGTTMGTDWRDNDPYIEPVAEIFQGLRTSYELVGAPLAAEAPRDEAHMKQVGYFPEGMLSNAWAKGYKLGVIASSDHASTHISYAMVYTDDFSRRGILDALRKRHAYGAMDNIILDVRMGDYMMGDEFSLARPRPLRVKARGTRPVARVDVIKDSKVIYSVEPKRQEVEFEFTDRSGVSGRHYYYVRLQQVDGMTAWSSPMFINY